MIRLTASRRLLHVGVLMGAAAAAALAFETWVPAVALVPLAGVLVLAILEVLLPLPVTASRSLELGDRLLANDTTRVDLVMEGAVAPFNLWAEDGIPEGLHLLKTTTQPVSPAGGANATTSYRVLARRRGEHDFDVVRAHRTSALGLLDRSVEVPAPMRVTVLPPSARHLAVRVRPRPPTGQGVPTRSMRRGPGDEFFALRQYQPGDTISDVNWKASARLNRIITNEFLPDEPPRYLIYVDARASGAEHGEHDVFERSLTLAAILSDALLDARAHVGMVLLSFHSQFVVPGGGFMQARRLQRMLIDSKPGYEASISQLVLAGVAHLPARAEAILITANVYDPTLSQAVSFLRARHGRVLVLAPGFPEVEGDDLDAAAARAASALLNAEQAAALAGILPYADRVAQWPPAEPISVTLARLDMSGRVR